MKYLALSLALVGVIGVGVAIAGDAPSGIRRTELQRGAVPNSNYVTIVARTEIDKGASTGWHTHPGDEMTVVLTGSLTVQVKGQPDKVVKAGESFRVPAGIVHSGSATSENFTGTGVYVVESDKPLASPVAP